MVALADDLSLEQGLSEEVRENLPALLRVRAAVFRRAGEDQRFRDDLWVACSRSPLLWFDLFAWTLDPKRFIGKRANRPFVLYPFQREIVLDLVHAIRTGQDRIILKSRDMGMSWLVLLVYLWFWLFQGHVTFLVLSRNADEVDKPGYENCLFAKIDYAVERLPVWMRPNLLRTKMVLVNADTGASILGTSSTGDAGRGGRGTSMMCDEFASDDQAPAVLRATRDNTNCRIFVSTPKGAGNAFYELWQKNEIPRIKAHWSEHPVKRIGLYQSISGDLRVHDGDPIEDYAYICDGKLRSPWYDGECRRCVDEREIAQELDCDFAASDYTFFPAGLLSELEAEYVVPPVHVGEFDAIHEEFVESEGGPLQLWMSLDADGTPPHDEQYVGGVDVSAGTGASNSVISIMGVVSGRKVLEYATPFMQPDALAELAAALGRWLGGVIYCWENNGGPGKRFGLVLAENYGGLHYERDPVKGVAKEPGWRSNDDGKDATFIDYRYALSKRHVINPSKLSLDEHRNYIWGPTGHVQHSGSLRALDPSGAKRNHGDRCAADAIMWRAAKRFRPRRRLDPARQGKVVITEDNVLEVRPNCKLARRVRRQMAEVPQELPGW